MVSLITSVDEAAARTLRDWRRVAVLRVNVEHCNYCIYQQPSCELRQRYHHHAATVPAILCGGWQAQRMAWNRVRSNLDDKLDMFFWRGSALERLAGPILQARDYSTQSFKVSPLLTFPPVFSLPNLRVPRFMYPFDIKMYKWSF